MSTEMGEVFWANFSSSLSSIYRTGEFIWNYLKREAEIRQAWKEQLIKNEISLYDLEQAWQNGYLNNKAYKRLKDILLEIEREQQEAKREAERQAELEAWVQERLQAQREEQAKKTPEQKAQEKKQVMSKMRIYESIGYLVYTYFFVSIMPCADIFIGRLIMAVGENRTLSEIIGNSGKAFIIVFWFIFWLLYLFISAIFLIHVFRKTGEISDGGNKRFILSFFAAGLSSVIFFFPQAADIVCSWYDELRSFFALSPMIFGITSLLGFFALNFIMMGSIRKNRETYASLSD